MTEKFWCSVDALALVAATAKTVLELGAASTGPRPIIKEWWVDFDGVSGTAVPVHIEVGRFSAGVTTATTASEKQDNDGPAPLTTAKHSTSTEGAGTADDIQHFRCSPTSGRHYIAVPGDEFRLDNSAFWRMRLTAPANVNCTVGVIWEE